MLCCGLSSGMGLLVILGILLVRRLNNERRNLYFKKQNGGVLLQQQLSYGDGVIGKIRIFTASELKKATDNFNEKKIIGQGGQGTIFKGILTDGRVVAIKRSKKVDVRNSRQFINELVILSQIEHRNVVKLLGCCLETEIPLLVYEFISNGTLAQHIHNPDKELRISWKMRLQIAAESAGAIAYLHSSSSSPIYHRDVKSSNILLNDKCVAKVSDFGISRTITVDQTHLTTQVLGTFGYLDPEYCRSCQFTEKSDVYSFGVVLVELLTSKKPIFTDESNEVRSLATKFSSVMKRSCLLDFVDPQVSKEATNEEIMTFAELAGECISLNGKYRPTMKEVAAVLEGLKSQHGTSTKQCTLTEGDCTCVAAQIDEVDTGPFVSSTFCSY